RRLPFQPARSPSHRGSGLPPKTGGGGGARIEHRRLTKLKIKLINPQFALLLAKPCSIGRQVLECGSPVPLSERRGAALGMGRLQHRERRGKSAAGATQSKTWRSFGGAWWPRHVLECGSPVPLLERTCGFG